MAAAMRDPRRPRPDRRHPFGRRSGTKCDPSEVKDAQELRSGWASDHCAAGSTVAAEPHATYLRGVAPRDGHRGLRSTATVVVRAFREESAVGAVENPPLGFSKRCGPRCALSRRGPQRVSFHAALFLLGQRALGLVTVCPNVTARILLGAIRRRAGVPAAVPSERQGARTQRSAVA